MSILAVDVGNTNVVMGVYDEDIMVTSFRMTTSMMGTADEVGVFICSMFERMKIDIDSIEGVIISSVVPDLMYSLRHGITKYIGKQTMVVGPGIKTGINLRMENPKELGADRLTNLVAGYHIYGGPIIICDYGTATKYDIVSEKGEFLTGITAPGIRISADALFGRAAMLSKVEIKLPSTIMAKNTHESIQCGIVFGAIGEAEYIVNRLKRETNLPNAKVVATGGLSRVVYSGTDIFDYHNPWLTLEGLKILYRKNTVGK